MSYVLIINGNTVLKRLFTQLKKEAGAKDYIVERKRRVMKDGSTKFHHYWKKYEKRPDYKEGNVEGRLDMLAQIDDRTGEPKYKPYDKMVNFYQEYIGKELPRDLQNFYPYTWLEEGIIKSNGKHIEMEKEHFDLLKEDFPMFNECDVVIVGQGLIK